MVADGQRTPGVIPMTQSRVGERRREIRHLAGTIVKSSEPNLHSGQKHGFEMVKVIAVKDHQYAQVERRPGDVYEATEGEVVILSAYGYVNRVMEEPVEVSPSVEVDKRQRYKRRDMRPER